VYCVCRRCARQSTTRRARATVPLRSVNEIAAVTTGAGGSDKVHDICICIYICRRATVPLRGVSCSGLIRGKKKKKSRRATVPLRSVNEIAAVATGAGGSDRVNLRAPVPVLFFSACRPTQRWPPAAAALTLQNQTSPYSKTKPQFLLCCSFCESFIIYNLHHKSWAQGGRISPTPEEQTFFFFFCISHIIQLTP